MRFRMSVKRDVLSIFACLTVLLFDLSATRSSSQASSGAAATAQTTVKPYKFGFSIDEQQHRTEKRDERGIVMGEFGFITADGIYHVTVYATDEEGKFRILAMRSYPYEAKPKMIDMVVVPKTTSAATSPKQQAPKYNFQTTACSGCFLKTVPPKDAPAVLAKPLARISPGHAGNTQTAAKSSNSKNPSAGNKVATPTGSKPKPITPGQSTFKAQSPPATGAKSAGKVSNSKPTRPAIQFSSNFDDTRAAKGAGKSTVAGTSTVTGSKFGPKLGPSSSAGTFKGTDVKAATAPNRSGVPAAKGGSGAVGETGDLYRFKYTLDYNGHSETGSRNGNKVGTYFSLGDDNVERTIEYIANEFGYQPRIRWRKLDAPVAAKENALKDYEFVWFKQQ